MKWDVIKLGWGESQRRVGRAPYHSPSGHDVGRVANFQSARLRQEGCTDLQQGEDCFVCWAACSIQGAQQSWVRPMRLALRGLQQSEECRLWRAAFQHRAHG